MQAMIAGVVKITAWTQPVALAPRPACALELENTDALQRDRDIGKILPMEAGMIVSVAVRQVLIQG